MRKVYISEQGIIIIRLSLSVRGQQKDNYDCCYLQELNRVHKAAVSSGFLTLLTGLSNILEREVTMLPPTAHPDASIQLQHAASLLRHKDAHYMDYIIQPLDTNYSDNI